MNRILITDTLAAVFTILAALVLIYAAVKGYLN